MSFDPSWHPSWFKLRPVIDIETSPVSAASVPMTPRVVWLVRMETDDKTWIGDVFASCEAAIASVASQGVDVSKDPGVDGDEMWWSTRRATYTIKRCEVKS